MDAERAVDAGHLVQIGPPGAAPAVVRAVRAVLVAVEPNRRDLVSAVNQQLRDTVNIVPVYRAFQQPPVVNQHDDQCAAEQAAPTQRLRKAALIFQCAHVALNLGLDVLIFQTQREAIAHGIVGRGINDRGKQAVANIEICQLRIRYHRASGILILRGGVVLCTVFGKHVKIAVLTELIALHPWRGGRVLRLSFAHRLSLLSHLIRPFRTNVSPL